jgi:hypothetical protein
LVEYKYLTISESFALLSKLDLTTPVEKQGLEYLEKFHSLKPTEVKKAIKELSAVADLPDKVIVKIIDLAFQGKASCGRGSHTGGDREPDGCWCDLLSSCTSPLVSG